MFYLLVMIMFLPVSLHLLCFLFYLQKAVFVQSYTVLSEFRPMKDDD